MVINQSVQYAAPSDHLSLVFAALADPTRRAIITMLRSGEATVTELAAPFKMSLPAVSKHLKVLERAGLISQGKQAQWRPRRLEADSLKEVTAWMANYRQFLDESLDNLESYVQEYQKERMIKETKGEHHE